MAYEKLVKRTIWVAKCKCGYKDERIDNPPREILCPKCNAWIPYVEESYIGKDRFDQKD